MSSARNVGIKESTGGYIAFRDADDMVLNDSLKKEKEFLDRNQNVDLVFTDWYIDKEDKPVLKSANFLDSFKDVFYSNGSDFISKDGFLVKFLNFCPHPIFAVTSMIRSKIIERFGLFRTDLLNAEDLEFILRIIEKSRVGYIDQPLYLYRHHLSQNTKKLERYYFYEIKVYEELKSKNISTDINRILKRKISDTYFEFGYFYKQGSLFDSARKCLIRSIINNPFQIRSYKTFIGTFLPVGLRKILKGIL